MAVDLRISISPSDTVELGFALSKLAEYGILERVPSKPYNFGNIAPKRKR